MNRGSLGISTILQLKLLKTLTNHFATFKIRKPKNLLKFEIFGLVQDGCGEDDITDVKNVVWDPQIQNLMKDVVLH